jgi:signal transduction histidine kinase/HAMP domain-containing protein
LALFAVALVGPLAFTGFLLKDDFQVAEERAQATAVLAARLASDDIENALASNRASAQVIEQLPGFWNETDVSRDRLLAAVSKPHSHLNGMIFFTSDFEQHGATYQQPDEPRNSMAVRAYAQEAVRTGQPAFADEVVRSAKTDLDILSMVIPVHEPEPGNRIGFVTAAFRMDRFALLWSDQQLPAGSSSWLVDTRSGRLLGGTGALGVPLNTPVAWSLDLLKGTGDQTSLHARGPDGDVLMALDQVDGTPWVVVVQTPTAVIYAPILVSLLQRLTVVSAIAAAIAFILLSAWRSLRNRFAALRRAAERFGHGDWSHRTGLLEDDELGRLAVTLEGMADQLAGMFARERQIHLDIERERANREAVLASMSDGLVVIGVDGKVAYSNSLAATLLGLPPQALQASTAETLSGFITPLVGDGLALTSGREAAAARLRQGLNAQYELTLVGPPRRDLEVRIFPISVGTSNVIGVLLRDRTAEQDLARAKDDLLSMVTHDLASPATNVASYAALLSAPGVSEDERRQTAATLLAESQRLITIIQDFIELRRLERGHLTVETAPTDVRSLLQHAAAIAAHDATAHHIELAVPAALPLVQADSNRTQQVLTNLLSNARKYSPAGGTIRLEARVAAGALEIAVLDEGLGFPIEELPRLFDRFFRVEGADRHQISGTGLGLAIVKELVEAQHGTVGAYSAGPGKGARFWFTLPLATQVVVPPETGEHDSQPADRGRLSVLAVDDDQSIGSAVARLLRPDGHRVRAVTSADDALLLLDTHHKFDVILLDHGLGAGLDGLALARLIRERLPNAYIVLASGSGFDIEQASASGVNSILPKPYEPHQLRAVLADVRAAA